MVLVNKRHWRNNEAFLDVIVHQPIRIKMKRARYRHITPLWQINTLTEFWSGNQKRRS